MAKSHPKKVIKEALQYATNNGWTIESSGNSAHAWGFLKCPYNSKDCREGANCLVSIWGTPKSPENHARQIIKVVDKCVMKPKSKTD